MLKPYTKAKLNKITAELENDPNTYGNWKRICARARVYRNAKAGVVLKQPNFILEPDTPVKFRVKTVELDYGWVLQPYYPPKDTAGAARALEAIMGKWAERSDVHHLNARWTPEGPKLIDW